MLWCSREGKKAFKYLDHNSLEPIGNLLKLQALSFFGSKRL